MRLRFPGRRRSTLSATLPDGSWDCHAHVIEDPERYPLAPGRGYDPPLAPLEDYLALLDRYGLARGVLVQPSVYGFDNRCLLDALDRAAGRLVGVAVPGPELGPDDLEELHRRGVRGVRCNLLNSGGLAPEVVLEWQPVLGGLGWHVELHVDVERIDDLRAWLARFEVPVVVDHMGRPGARGSRSGGGGFGILVDLVGEGACMVKLSAPYRLSTDPPPWRDVTRIARTFLEANPDACLWGSDWPHTDTDRAIEPDALLQALYDWCPESGTRRLILTEAPGRLFRSRSDGAPR